MLINKVTKMAVDLNPQDSLSKIANKIKAIAGDNKQTLYRGDL